MYYKHTFLFFIKQTKSSFYDFFVFHMYFFAFKIFF